MAPATALIIGGLGLQALAQAAMAEFNAKVAEQQAQAKRNAARFQQERQAKAGERVRSGLQAQFGASGGVPSEGIPLLIEAEQVAENELENLLIGQEGEVQAQRSESQAAGFRLQSSIFKQRASNARIGGFIGAGSSLLTGFGKL